MAGVFADCDMHPQADPQVRDVVLPCDSSCSDLALESTTPEATRNQDAVDVQQQLIDLITADGVRIDPLNLDLAAVVDAAMAQRFADRR